MRDGSIDERIRTAVIGEAELPAIVIVDHDPAWAGRFRREEASIQRALGAAALRIEHIGSTAVPGLAAKPIVDILVVVDNAADEDSYVPALQNAGYGLRIREPDFNEHRMLRNGEKDVHVHVYPPDSPEIDRYLLLRDHLRVNASERALYARAKRELAAETWPTIQHYSDAKTEVVEAIIARATEAQSLNQN
ncbi:hypothetical protein BH23ACT11_BH23ACT11_18100 [soil metagenome]